ncbi:MAG: hypothetical protein AAGE94_09295 [Acidobacteriota bacterium]
MAKKYRYLLTVDADTGDVDKIELLGESGDLTEIPPSDFPLVPAGSCATPVAVPASGGNVVIHVYAGGQAPTVTTHEASAAAAPMMWPGTQTARPAGSPMMWPGTQTAQAASSPMGWPGTQTAQAEAASSPTGWPGPVTRDEGAAEPAAAEPADKASEDPGPDVDEA